MYKSKKVIMLEYIPLRILMEIISFSPYIFVVLFAKLIGALMYYLVPSARKVALINLKPDMMSSMHYAAVLLP